MPQEFTTVSASSYDSAALATKLTEKSAEGWDVVGIVNTSTEVTAFLSRAAGSTSSGSGTSGSSAAAFDSASSSTPSSTSSSGSSEPSGWGTAPASSSSSPSSSSTTAVSPSADPSSGYQAQSTPATAQPAAAASSAPSVPAGWYADPAGRFDLRYWDGGTWTEHVSRAGQQFTDPPVA
jgi:hypothetical protein